VENEWALFYTSRCTAPASSHLLSLNSLPDNLANDQQRCPFSKITAQSASALTFIPNFGTIQDISEQDGSGIYVAIGTFWERRNAEAYALRGGPWRLEKAARAQHQLPRRRQSCPPKGNAVHR